MTPALWDGPGARCGARLRPAVLAGYLAIRINAGPGAATP